MPPRILLPLLCGTLAMLLVGCGFREVSVVDFNLFLNSKDPSFQTATAVLISAYNQRLGANVLKSSTSPGSTSSVIWTKGLQNRDGKIGYGQWQTDTRQDSEMLVLIGQKPTRAVTYAMHLEFDQDFFADRMNQQQSSAKWQELFVLFCHEVGHGLMMDHSPDTKSVMYKFVEGSDGVKIDEYFRNARAFFNDRR